MSSIMSIFRFGTIRSPPRRPTVQGSEQSPFCTSPSQLQDVTLDQNETGMGTIPFTLGLRSPGKTSPIRGRTMKEFEEQLSQLKKENFNLKLRIYFLEERMGHMNGVDDREDPVKKNIELKVEAETLRKEVSDKQDLLCQAAKALDLIEEQHRGELQKFKEERNLEKGTLESRIQELESELKEFEEKMKNPKLFLLDNTANDVCPNPDCNDHHTHEEAEKLQHQIEELESQVQNLECTLQEETMRSEQLEADLQEAQQEAERVCVRCHGLEVELKQRDCKLEDLVQELEQKGQDLAGCNLRIRTLEEALSAKEPEIQIKVQELCERDRIIEEKQSQIEQQNKVLVEIQITLDEKQRQIETLRSSLAARDTSIADLEGRLSKARANARNLEAKLDASVHEANTLREEVETLKAQQKRMNKRNREQLQQECDLLSPLRWRNSNHSNTSDEKTSPGRRIRPISEDEGIMRKRLLDLKEKEQKLKIMEDNQGSIKTQFDEAQKEVQILEGKVKQLESGWKDAEFKLKETEKKMKDKDDRSKKLEDDHLKACQAIKSFMKRTKDLGREMDQLKSEMKKKDCRIHDLTSEMNELKDACNKANWEARQLQAQARVQGGGGIPNAFEDVRDMTEEENERLWAEVEDKNKKLAQLTKERDNLSIEMEKQVQGLISSLKEKEMLLDDYERKSSSSQNEVEVRDNHIKKLADEVRTLRKELETLKTKQEIKGNDDETGRLITKNIEESSSLEGTVVGLEEKSHERLSGELKTNAFEELVKKELQDKNHEIEKLQDQLNNVGERKELEIMFLQQQLGVRDLQLKMFQDKISELGIHINLPATHVMRELQLAPFNFNHIVQFQQLPLGENTRLDTGVTQNEMGIITPTNSISAEEVSVLRNQLQVSVEERRYLCHKIEELHERLRNTPERDNDSRTLRSECVRQKEELDRANIWRKEAGEAYVLLTTRLEELSRFLSSLLEHPEQLSILGSKERQSLKQAVERSMELSQTLSLTFTLNNKSLSNNSFPPLMDSFSSILLSTYDANLSLSSLLKEYEHDETLTGICDNGQQDNFKSGTSPLNTNTQFLRNSGSNSEFPELRSENNMSEENYLSKDAIIEKQTEVINHLRLQLGTLRKEIKERDMQNDEIKLCPMPESRSKSENRSHGSPSKESVTSSGTIWKSGVADIEKIPESSSMTFLNNECTNNVNEQLNNQSQNLNISLCQQSNNDMLSQSSLEIMPGETDDINQLTLKNQGNVKSTKSPISYNMCRSSSASAVATNQILHAIQPHDVAAGSLSESEAWSEPDRNVSLARIGLTEELSKAALPSGNGVLSSSVISNSRPRNGRIIQEDAETSESTEETVHENNRIQGKRGRSDPGELRRLQNRLRALEQVNEALRTELTILHQLASRSTKTVMGTSDEPCTRDISINTSQITSEMKLDKSTSIEQLEDKKSDHASITIPIHLLDQIRFQREKLESSLYHNDFIRFQLEGIISSINCKGDDNMVSMWQKMKETSEQFEEARQKSQELELKLQAMEVQLLESKEKARLANTVNEQLQVTRQTVSILQEQISTLEARLQEKDNEILEKRCQILELENVIKKYNKETEKNSQETAKLMEEAERQIKTAENVKQEGENKLQEACRLMKEADNTKVEAERKLIEINQQYEDIQQQTKMIQVEKETIIKEREIIQKSREITHQEKDTIQREKEAILKEKEILQEEKKILIKEKEIMQKDMEEKVKQIDSFAGETKKQKEEAEMKLQIAKQKKQEAELLKQDADRQFKETEEKAILLEKRSKEIELRLVQQLCEGKKTLEEKEWCSKTEMDRRIHGFRAETETRIRDIEEKNKEHEEELIKRLQESEKHCRETECELLKQLDEFKLASSQSALERTHLLNDKLQLEQEIRHHEARESELIREKKDAENNLLIAKEQLDKEMQLLQQQKNDLEIQIKELEAANFYFKSKLFDSQMKQGPTSVSGGEGSSLPTSPWGTTASASLEYSGSQNEDREHYINRNKGSDADVSGEITTLSSMVLQHGFGRQRSELSDYMSEDQPLEEHGANFSQTYRRSCWVTRLVEQHLTHSESVPTDHCLLRNINSSPDLGIESDQGRFSSLEATSSGMQIDTSKLVSTMEGCDSDIEPNSAIVINSRGDTSLKSYKELEQENIVLKRRLTRTRLALEETLAQLTAANQKKKQVERAICKQLHKTHHILKKARVNLDVETTTFITPSTEEIE